MLRHQIAVVTVHEFLVAHHNVQKVPVKVHGKSGHTSGPAVGPVAGVVNDGGYYNKEKDAAGNIPQKLPAQAPFLPAPYKVAAPEYPV